MSMLDALNQAGAAQSISRDLGVDQQTAQSGLAALLPAVLGGMQNQAQAQPQGLGGLAAMLGQHGGGQLFDQAVSHDPTPVGPGNQLLGQLFGSKDTSRTIAQHAASQTGLSPDLLKKMLPIVAMLAAGYFAKQAGGSNGAASSAGGLGGMLGGALDGGALGGAVGGGSAGSAMGNVLGSLLGGGSGAGGNPLNAILGGLVGTGRR